jgi:hypothetical protein
MKAQASSNMKAQAPSNKQQGRGPAHKCVVPATNCRAAICHIDTRSKVQAPRLKLRQSVLYFFD